MKALILSKKAIEDLRLALKRSYGEDVDKGLSDAEISMLGDLFLTILAESTMLEIAASRLKPA